MTPCCCTVPHFLWLPPLWWLPPVPQPQPAGSEFSLPVLQFRLICSIGFTSFLFRGAGNGQKRLAELQLRLAKNESSEMELGRLCPPPQETDVTATLTKFSGRARSIQTLASKME